MCVGKTIAKRGKMKKTNMKINNTDVLTQKRQVSIKTNHNSKNENGNKKSSKKMEKET